MHNELKRKKEKFSNLRNSKPKQRDWLTAQGPGVGAQVQPLLGLDLDSGESWSSLLPTQVPKLLPSKKGQGSLFPSPEEDPLAMSRGLGWVPGRGGTGRQRLWNNEKVLEIDWWCLHSSKCT